MKVKTIESRDRASTQALNNELGKEAGEASGPR